MSVATSLCVPKQLPFQERNVRPAERRIPTRRWEYPREFRAALVLGAVALGLRGGEARANGRFPGSQFVVVGPGARDDLIAVRTTFGLVASDDGGQRFRFLCEEAFGYPDGYDPALAWTSAGTLLVSTRDGLAGTQDLCDPRRRTELDGQRVVDLAWDPSGRVILAALQSPDAVPVMRVARSDDGGERFEVPREGVAAAQPLTVEVAPSDASRAYASALVGDLGAEVPAVFRSDDGGRTWARTRAAFPGAADVYVSGVDPLRPDVVYARSRPRGATDAGGLDDGASLLQSDDGALSFREVARTLGPMRGFALSGDGRRAWIGGSDPRDGLQRRDGDGAFARVADLGVECLRWHAGALYLCESLGQGGAVLSRLRDGAAARESLVRVEGILGPPPACARGTVTRDFCPARWSAVRAGVLTQLAPDGGALDASVDAARDAPADGGALPAPKGCDGCAVGQRGGGRGALAALLAGAWALLRRRRATERETLPEMRDVEG